MGREYQLQLLTLLVTLLYHVQQGQGECPSGCTTCTTKVKPRHGSVEGGVRITIDGEGFVVPRGLDPNEGSHVKLICAQQQYNCTREVSTMSATRIVCVTPPMPQSDVQCEAHIYHIVNKKAVMVAKRCITPEYLYNGKDSRTPTVDCFNHTQYIAKSVDTPVFLTIKGKFFTDKTDNTQSDSESNRIIRRVYTGGSTQGWKITTDLKISNYNKYSYRGELTFRDYSGYGCHCVDYIVEDPGGEYGGRSKTSDSCMMWNPDGQPYCYQVYPVIKAISPVISSRAGGTRITLWGISKIDIADAIVKVGGVLCKVVESTDTYLVALTPPEPGSDQCTFQPGNRGISCKTFNGQDFNQTSARRECWDVFGFTDTVGGVDYSTECIGCFKPPKDLEYLFKQSSDDQGRMYFDSDPCNNTENMIMDTEYNTKAEHTTELLSKEKCYYVRGTHVQGNGGSNYHFGMFLSNTKDTKQDTPYPFVHEEIQIVHACSGIRRPDIWLIKLPNSAVTFAYGGKEANREKVTTSDRLKEIFYDLLSCHCQPLRDGIQYTNDYETDRHALKDDPLCGHAAVKNPHTIYNYYWDEKHKTNLINLATSHHVCYGLKGSFNKVHVAVRLYRSGNKQYKKDWWWDISQDLVNKEAKNFNSTKTWDFKCIDIYRAVTAMMGRSGDDIVKNGTKTITLVQVVFEKHADIRFDYLLDTAQLGTIDAGEKDKVMSTRKCIKPGGEMVESISVKSIPVTDEEELKRGEKHFEMSVHVYHCGVNLALPTFGPNDKASAVKQQSTRRGATGEFKIGLNDKLTLAIPILSTAKTVMDKVNAALPLVKVVVSDGGNSCHRPHYNIHYPTMAGDQPQLTINSSTVSCIDDEQGNRIVNGPHIYTRQDGGLSIVDIPSDMIRTIHTDVADRQVTLELNTSSCTVPAKCEMNPESSCSISWHESVTPKVSVVSPAAGQAGTTITITGINMQGNLTDQGDVTTVTVGGELCTVLIKTDTMITCTMGQCGQGRHKVIVHIRGKGDAQHPTKGNIMFECKAAITAIIPDRSGRQGGYKATITGYGFALHVTVKVGGNAATNLAVSYNAITFDVPASETEGDVSVVVSHDGTNAAGTLAFTYLPQTNATLLSLSPTELSVSGGLVTITVRDLPPDVPQSNITVMVDSDHATLISASQSQLVVLLPSSAQGVKSIQVKLGPWGYADANSLTITYVFHVTSVCPERGSYAGGTSITITGSGFTNTSVVTIGGVPCTVDTQTDTQIVCVTGPIHKTWIVTNNGRDLVNGFGYAWYPEDITVKTGDTIKWIWSTPTLNRVMCPGQTETALSEEYLQSSKFKCDQPTQKGIFEWTFTDTEVLYYSSGFIDPDEKSIIARGTVTASMRTSEKFTVVVTTDGYTASYNTQGAASCTTQDIPSCTDDSPAGAGNAGEVGFTYSKCSTYVITGINPTRDVQPDGTITVTMPDGTTDKSQVTVTVCDKSCEVTAATTTSITCTIQHDNNLPVNQQCPVIVTISNFGMAYVQKADAKDKSLQILPAINSLSPRQGSNYGGTRLTISGIGFMNVMSVIYLRKADGSGIVICDLLNFSYTEVQCQTRHESGDKSYTILQVFLALSATLTVTCTKAACGFEKKNAPNVANYEDQIPDSPYTWILTGTYLNGGEIKILSNKYPSAATPDCTNYKVTNNKIECTLADLQYEKDGYYFYIITPGGYSKNYSVNVLPSISSFTPTTSNKCGGLKLTIIGVGFMVHSSTVKVGHSACPVTSVTPTRIECMLPPGSNEKQLQVILPDMTVRSTDNFVYGKDRDVTFTSISITEGKAGDQVTLTGASFGTKVSDVTVTVGGAGQTVDTVTDTSVVVTLVHYAACTYNVAVIIANKGCGTQDPQHPITFKYQLQVTSFSPLEGSFGGSQNLTIVGTGFNLTDTNVTICGLRATVFVTDYTSLTVITPRITDRTGVTAGTLACIVSVSVGCDFSQNATSAFTYRDSLTPTITSVTPARGGTGGNTRITIVGVNFGTVQGTGFVTIEGVGLCGGSITWNQTHIYCNVPRPPRSMNTHVAVTSEWGVSVTAQDKPEAANFWYIDAWSSPWTWGGGHPPLDEEFVEVSAVQCILIDEDTAILKMLLINGGCILFDETVEHIILSAENILIINNGTMQIGTEGKPYCPNKVTIVMYGQLRSIELPIYGAKALATRNGTLTMCGCPIETTWTRLSQDAAAGSNTLHLNPPAHGWKVGDLIVIATTGNYKSQSESQTAVILTISPDKRTITIHPPLQAPKSGSTKTITTNNGTINLPMHGEVGLLTRNIKFTGTGASAAKPLPTCPDNFKQEEFGTQTCIPKGKKVTSPEQFGGHIIGHNPAEDSQAVKIRICFVELTYVGQAFRLGRYPIHFHLNGNMSGSYVRGCGIHITFNRAINIHGSHYILIEHNVVYKSMGGTFFFEDGIEMGNVYKYNLIICPMASSSLLTDDLQPAAFWITNPNNTVSHNVAAGGTHFGFWYRMHPHGDGASAHVPIDPQKITLGVFENNTAHSMGEIGLWIFQDYFPVKSKCFETFTVWHCKKGFESVDVGPICFKGFLSFINDVAQFEAKLASNLKNSLMFTHEGSVVQDTVLVNYIDTPPPRTSPHSTPRVAAIIPQLSGFLFENVTFVHCSGGTVGIAFAHISGTCSKHCSGYIHQVANVHWVSCTQRVYFEWQHQAALQVDASFRQSGNQHGVILPTVPILPATHCQEYDGGYNESIAMSFCDDRIYVVGVGFNGFEPQSYRYKDLCFRNEHGVVCVPFKDKSKTHKEGWKFILIASDSNRIPRYYMYSLGGTNTTNIKYNAIFYRIPKGVCFEIAFSLEDLPDKVKTTGSFVNASSELKETGDWIYQQGTLIYRVCGPATEGVHDVAVHLEAFKCLYTGCVIPSGDVPFAVFTKCLNTTTTWEESKVDWSGQNAVIAADKCVKITASGTYTVLSLVILGTLEVDNNADIVVVIVAKYVLIMRGYLVVGTTEKPFKGQFTLKMIGDPNTDDPYFTYSYKDEKSSTSGEHDVKLKEVLVLGGLELHGIKYTGPCTKLTKTVNMGETKLLVRDKVDWPENSELFVTTTSFRAGDGEVVGLLSVQDYTLTTKTAVKNEHRGTVIVVSETPQRTVKTQGEVCLLTRNIRISGAEGYEDPGKDFGFSVMVGVGIQVLTSERSGKIAKLPRRVKGYARIWSVAFIAGGKGGQTWLIPGQAEHVGGGALMYVSLGETNTATTLPNWIKHSSFYQNRGVGICIIDSHRLEAHYDFSQGSKPHGIYVSASMVSLKYLVIADTIWPGSTGNSNPNRDMNAAYNLERAINLILQYNIGAGFQRACMKLPHNPCTESDQPLWYMNECHGGLIGIERLVKSGPEGVDKCMEVAHFFAWNCWDYGVFIEVKTNIKVKNYIGVSANVFLIIYTPSALNKAETICHNQTKKITITDSVIVGRAPDDTCLTQDMDKDKTYYTADRDLIQPSKRNGTGRVAITFTLTGGHNDAGGSHPMAGIMAYNTVCGLFEIIKTLFSHFNKRCGYLDTIVGINDNNEDLTHPIHLKEITFSTVLEDAKVYIPRPNPKKVNLDDCGGMICDGKKKALIKDVDGTFFKKGRSCAAISDAGYGWGVEASGLNMSNDRLPAILREVNQTKVDIDRVYPNKGILRNPQCVYKKNWQAYLCCGLEYFQLVIQSLDEDTEDRTLGPIAFLSGPSSSELMTVDLVNGPQDHGWCDGYPCNRRVSNFHFIVAADSYFDVYLSSTPPQHMRLQMLNSAPYHCIRLAMYYKTKRPSRLDVFHNNKLKTPETAPVVLGPNPISGANYPDEASNLLNIIICGQNVVLIYLAPGVQVNIDVPTPQDQDPDVYAGDVGQNLADYLEVDAEGRRKTDIVEDPTGRRRRREANTMTIAVTIESPQASSPGGADAAAQTTQEAGSTMVSAIQLGTLDDVVKTTVLSATVQQPPPLPGTEAWAEYAADENAGQPVTIQTPKSAISLQAPKPSHEGAPFTVYPTIRLLDVQGSPVELLGTVAVPWRMKAELVLGAGSDSRAVLWDNEVSFYKGWANFAKLSISHSGSGYGLRFYVSYPAEASARTDLQVSVSDLTVAEAAFKAQFRELPTEILPTDSFKVSVDVLDTVTNMLPKNISWKGHSFTATIRIDSRSGYPGTLSPSSELQMVLSTDGSAMTGNLRLDSVGTAILSVSVVSSPADFSLKASSSAVDVNQVRFSSRSAQSMSEVMMRFPGLSELAENLLPFFLAAVQNKFSPVYKDVTFNNFTRSENELDFVVWGSQPEIKRATDAIWDRILEGLKISSGGQSYEADAYMLVDGVERVGEKKTDGGNLGAIIAGSIIGVILVIIVVAVLAWFLLKGKPKSAVEPSKATEADAENVETGAAGNNSKPDEDDNKKAEEVDVGKTDNVDKAEVEDIVEDL